MTGLINNLIYIGCYTDNSGGVRDLNGTDFYTGLNANTVKGCMGFCKSYGIYKYAGLQASSTSNTG